MTSSRKRSGFSLAEILVAMAILAVVGAVVIPSIGGQLRAGDESRVQQDLGSIRGGVEQFLADVRRYPKSVGQLTNVPTAVTHSALVGGTYTAGQITRWRGPYITKDSVQALKTGFDATVTSAFDTATVNGIAFLRITVPSFDSTNAIRLDRKMDDGDLTSGLVRWIVATSPSGTLYYHALPVQ